MIITRTPLRISFVGGGSDLPAHYREHGGAVVSACIDKYVFVAVNPKYDGAIRAAYSVTENVTRLDELRHDLIRETLRLTGDRGIEIHSIADIPGGTGLGSSSAFTVGLLKALRPEAAPRVLAGRACEVEIERCGHPIGKQDQYAAAFGGINLLRFRRDGDVEIEHITCDTDKLSDHLLLLDTGLRRVGTAGEQLKMDTAAVCELAGMAAEFAYVLRRGDLAWCGAILHDAWQLKRRACTTAQIDAWYEQARAAGAWGGKLCGAGGGGFLVFLAPPERHAAIVEATGLRAVPIRAGVAGSEVLWYTSPTDRFAHPRNKATAIRLAEGAWADDYTCMERYP